MRLPLPGSPGSSWSLYRSRLLSKFEGANPRVCVAFWLFGLINNIFYVIILSAALDLVGPDIPKGTVLLASVIPGLATKLLVPYVMHLIPYSIRVITFVVLSTCGMLVVALSPDRSASGISAKVAGIVLANISSGAGETHFLSLVHFYGPFSLAAWGSGTGGAGLVGAGAYALATTTFGFSAQTTLLASAVLPLGMLFSYFVLLPLGPLRTPVSVRVQTAIDDESDSRESEGLLTDSASLEPNQSFDKQSKLDEIMKGIRDKLIRTRPLFLPYMLPLFLVYAAEYTINQGIAPTLLFPLEDSPFQHYRGFYPTYGAIYQLGVFISRSSLPFIRIRSLYAPSLLQVLNMIGLGAQALFFFIPSVWFVFAIVLWEGLLGGLVYVSTFAAIREEVAVEDREFSLAAVTVSDSAGICVAGFTGVILESVLCAWQVRHGRDWCKRL